MGDTPIHLRLLGPFSATAGERDVTGIFSQPKRLAFITWLVLSRPGGLHRRDTICALLWPESNDQHARGALRQLLFTLRRELGEDAFVSDGDLLGLNRQVVSSDAGAVFDAFERGDDESAVALYTGELLPGLHLGEGDEFERWFDEHREALKRGVADAAWRLVDRAAGSGSLTEERRRAETALSLDPENETGLRRVLTLQARAGDRAAALRTHVTFARRLREDWGSEPEVATSTLVERIRRGELNGSDHSAVTAPGGHHPEKQHDSGTAIEGNSESRPWLLRGAAGLLAVTAAVAAAKVAFRGSRLDDSLVAARVMVVPFAVSGSGPTSGAAGLVAADWVIQGLQRSGRADVVDPATAFLATRDLPDRAPRGMESLRTLARRASAGLLVVGTVSLLGDSTVYTARVVDTRSGRVIRVLDAMTAPSADLSKVLDELRGRVAGAVAVETDRPIIPTSPGDRPPRLDAYEQFVLGLQAFVADMPGSGRPFFEETIRRDPSFTLARMWLYYSLNNNGFHDSARAVVRNVAASSDRWVPVVAAWLVIDSLELARAPLAERLQAYRRAAQLSPGSHNEWNLRAPLMDAGKVREAAIILERFEREQSWFTRWANYWYVRSTLMHWLGDYDGEAKAWARATSQHSYLRSVPWQVFADAARGNQVAIKASVDSALERSGDGPVPFLVGLFATHAGVELDAHGHTGLALSYLGWLEKRLQSYLASDTTAATRMNLASTQAALATLNNDTTLAGIAATGLEQLAAALSERWSDYGNNTRSAYWQAACAERNPRRIDSLPLKLYSRPPAGRMRAEFLTCKGDYEGAVKALVGRERDWTEHASLLLRPLRADPRFQRWLNEPVK